MLSKFGSDILYFRTKLDWIIGLDAGNLAVGIGSDISAYRAL